MGAITAAACSAGAAPPPPDRMARPAQTAPPREWIEHRAEHTQPSAAYTWVNVILEVTGRQVDHVGARPTIISRQMAIP